MHIFTTLLHNQFMLQFKLFIIISPDYHNIMFYVIFYFILYNILVI